MLKSALGVLVLGLAAGGCAGAAPTPEPEPGAVPEGYTRFVTSPVELSPGEEIIVNEWLSLPSGEDLDVLDVRGEESPLLHHFILYSTTDAKPVGTTRPWQDSDQITLGVRLLGGFGSEAVGSYRPPSGIVFRLMEGRSMLANVHYLNTSSDTVVTHAQVDVKLGPPSPDNQVAGMFITLDPFVSLPPQAETSLDVSCVVQHDIGLFSWANHMHELGTSVYSEVLREGEKPTDLRRDPTWDAEWAFNPRFVSWPPEAPLMLHAGDTVHTHCVFQNPGAEAVSFPHEMCLGLGFFVGDKDVTCLSGSWQE